MSGGGGTTATSCTLNITGQLASEIFYPGEPVICWIRFANTSSEAQYLHWASYQVYGHLVVDPSWIALSGGEQDTSSKINQGHGVGSILPPIDSKKGFFIFSSPQDVLACDVVLQPAESHTVMLSTLLPLGIPSSFTGSTTKISYVIAVKSQKEARGPTFVTRFPFRVINPKAALEACSSVTLGENGWNQASQKQSVPSLQHHLHQYDRSENEKKNELISATFLKGSKPSSINVTKNKNHIAHFYLPSTAYQLGDSVEGFFSFANAKLPCYQVTVWLVYSECIADSCLVAHRTPMNPVKHRIETFNELTSNVLLTSFRFDIPFEATPQLLTSQVNVKWSLEMTFVVGTQVNVSAEVLGTSPPNDATKRSEPTLPPKRTELLHWSFPLLVVVPTYPEAINSDNTHKLSLDVIF